MGTERSTPKKIKSLYRQLVRLKENRELSRRIKLKIQTLEFVKKPKKNI